MGGRMNNTGFWWILLAGGLYGLLHSILAANGTKAWAEHAYGPAAIRRYYRLFFVLMAGISLLPVLALVGLLPDQTLYTIPVPWAWLTLAAQAVAAAGLLLGVSQTDALSFLGIRQWLTFAPQHSQAHSEKLVTSGLYRWVRHPLYSFSFVLLWLLPLMTWNILALNLALSAYLVIGALFEERKLVQQFGADYEAYRRRTPMIVPWLKRP